MTLWHVEDCTPVVVTKPRDRRWQDGHFKPTMRGRP